MRARRSLLSVLLALGVVVLAAVPAFAHAAFDVQQLPAGGSESLALRVPIEVDAGNELVDVLVPAGWTVDVCVGADGWSCETTARDDGATVVNLARADDGAGGVEQFALELTAPEDQGTYAFPVVQTYDDGTESAWIGEPGGDRPAPVIQVGDDDTPVERSTVTPTHGETIPEPTASDGTASEPGPTPTPTPDPTASASVADPTASATRARTPDEASASPAPPDADGTDDDGGLPAVVWVVVAVALVGGVVWVVQRR